MTIRTSPFHQWLRGLPPERLAVYEARRDQDLAGRAVSGVITYELLLVGIFVMTPYLSEHRAMVLCFVGLTSLIGAVRLIGIRSVQKAGPDAPERCVLACRLGAYAAAAAWSAFVCVTLRLYPWQWTMWLTLFCTAGLAAGASSTLSSDRSLARRYLSILLAPAGLMFLSDMTSQSVTMGLIFFTNLAFLWTQTGQQYDWYWQRLYEGELLLEKSIEVQNVHAFHAKQIEEELESLKAHLQHVDRLATLGTLAGGVGHELNNMTTVLMAATRSIAADAVAGRAATEKDLDRLRRVESHVGLHARQLLSLGRPESEEPGAIDLIQVVRDTVDMLQAARRTRSVAVELELPSTPLFVHATKTRLEQVLVNLIGNAVDALDESKRALKRVSVRVERPGADGEVRIAVEDNGVGIAQDQFERIFQPYVTTKSGTRGTGLGLPVVRQILTGFGGSIAVSSELGVGTTFLVSLPGAAV